MFGVQDMFYPSEFSHKSNLHQSSKHFITLICCLLIIVLAFILPSQLLAQSLDENDEIRFELGLQSLGDTRTFGLDIADVDIADVDLDGDNEVFISNLNGPSRLWLNNGQRNFVQSGQNFYASPTVSYDAHDAAMAEDDYGNSKNFKIHENYPNPFNSSTTIPFEVKFPTEVTFSILDITGRRVANLSKGIMNSGYHKFNWNGRDHFGQKVPSGTYFCNMIVGKQQSRTIMLKLVK